MYIDLQVEYPLFLSDFNEILLSGSQVVPCGQTDMMTLISWFLHFCKRASKS